MSSNTYVALSTQTLGSAASSVTFSSIPQGYTDLVLVAAPIVSSDTYNFLSVNGAPSGTAYSLTRLQGNGTSATSSRESNVARINIYWSNASTPSTYIVNFQNYANTTTNKTILAKCSNTADSVVETVGMWSSTAAISSVVLTAQVGNYNAGSTFTLYGIAAASVGAKATGGTIYQDASYFYHVFSGNGTFTPSQSLSADVLVIAGGGGGGNDQGGGGGAGGVLAYTSQSLTTTGYTCTIGAGGASATNGVNSSFGALTASVGGGRGGYYNGVSGATGGSGGGGGGGNGSAGAGGSATSGQGYAGGSGYGVSPTFGGGGGGGSGAVGVDAVSGNPGSGGNGTTVYTSWLSATGFGQNVSGTYYIAGGGAGGGTQTGYKATGYGGGGQGGNNVTGGQGSGTAALANTGSGGGGAGAVGGQSGGAGGSGLVIVRYAK